MVHRNEQAARQHRYKTSCLTAAYLPVEQSTKFDLVINLKPPNKSASRFHRTCWRERIE
jgi:hypothetical protein